jgi:hypothetical protein
MAPKKSSTPFDANANNEGITPLHEAARDGLLNVVKLLIEASMNPSARDKTGSNALHYAAENGQHEVVRLLFEKVDPWLPDGAGSIPLHLAIKNEHYETVRIFRDVIKMRGGGLLHLAAAVGDIKYVQHILSTNIDKSDKDEGGFTPLHIAARGGLVDVVYALLAAGVDPNTLSSSGYSGVIFAAANASKSPGPIRLKGVATDHIAVIKALVHAGTDVNLEHGNNALYSPAFRHLGESRRHSDGGGCFFFIGRGSSCGCAFGPDQTHCITPRHKTRIRQYCSPSAAKESRHRRARL